MNLRLPEPICLQATTRLPALFLACCLTGANPAHADPLPARSSSFAGNYRTLVEDQKAPAAVARCIATAHDYAAKGRLYDRLGFTRDDIVAAVAAPHQGAFSATDPRAVTSTLAISGEGRRRNSGDWVKITLRCGERADRLAAIELVARP